ASGESRATSFGTASVNSVESSSTPITPVEAGSTYSRSVFSALATALQDASATCSPVRVAQFAFPALIRTAATLPFDDFKCVFAMRIGAACTTFIVKTAAAAAGVSG